MAETCLTIYLCGTIASQTGLEALIIASLSSKPLSLQNSIDWVVMDFVGNAMITAQMLFLYFLHKIWSFTIPYFISFGIAIIGQMSLLCLPLLFLACNVLRFLTVFHLDTQLEGFSDKMIHFTSRVVVLVMSSSLTGLSIYFDGYPRFYQELSGLEASPSEVIMTKILALLYVIAGGASLLLLFLIRREKRKLDQDAGKDSKMLW